VHLLAFLTHQQILKFRDCNRFEKDEIVKECGRDWREHPGSASTAHSFAVFSLNADELESSNLISDDEIDSWRQSFSFESHSRNSATLNLSEVQVIVKRFGEIDAFENEVTQCFNFVITLRENVDPVVRRIDCEEFELVMKMLKDLKLSGSFFSRGRASAAAIVSEVFVSAASKFAAFALSQAALCTTRFGIRLSVGG
jgi:hypothetical protein